MRPYFDLRKVTKSGLIDYQISFLPERGNDGIFWLRFHATFYNSLITNVSKNRAWPRPATSRSIATHIRNAYASPGSI